MFIAFLVRARWRNAQKPSDRRWIECITLNVQFKKCAEKRILERTIRVTFSNAVYLSLKYPDDSTALLSLLAKHGFPRSGNIRTITRAFRGFRCQGDWPASIGDTLHRLWTREERGEKQREEMLFALFAGLIVADQLPLVRRQIENEWRTLNAESRYLTSRLNSWRLTQWAPERAPFLEFALEFYNSGSVEQRIISDSIAEVLGVALALSDPWAVKLWADTGWAAGRRVGVHFPDTFRALLDELSPENFPRT
jgi:hypothetical protein